MLRWFVNQKRQREGAAPAAAVSENALAELEFLREQEDFDAVEMSSVSRDKAIDDATVSPPELWADFECGDPGATQPAIRISEIQYSSPSAPVAHLPHVRDEAIGQLTLGVLVDGRNSLLTVHDTVLIGRGDPEQGIHADVDLSVDDAVSRRHARIYRRGGQYFIQDLGSTNGTCHNGEWVMADRDEPLRNGDIILMGECSELQVLAVSFSTELSEEDRQIGGMLDQVLGTNPDDESTTWHSDLGEVRAGAPLDLLDVALSRGVQAGLLDGDTEWEVLAARPQWRLREFDGLELPSLVEPYR